MVKQKILNVTLTMTDEEFNDLDHVLWLEDHEYQKIKNISKHNKDEDNFLLAEKMLKVIDKARTQILQKIN